MNDRTRPPLDVEALAEALRKAGPFAGWNLSDEVLRRDAERIAAAYQPTGPDDLAGLLERVYIDWKRGIDHHHFWDYAAPILTARGVTLTGVRSSEARICPCGHGGHRPEQHPQYPGVRSSEVDGLREALLDIEQWSKGLGPTMSNNDPDAGRGTLGRIHRRATDALAGDTGPKVEPEP